MYPDDVTLGNKHQLVVPDRCNLRIIGVGDVLNGADDIFNLLCIRSCFDRNMRIRILIVKNDLDFYHVFHRFTIH